MFFDRELIWIHTAGYTFLYFGYGSILVGAMGLQARSGRTRNGVWKRGISSMLTVLAWTGVFSYGIYLWHIDFAQQPVWYHLQPKLGMFSPPTRWAIAMIVYLFVAVIAGAFMTYLIEFPILRLRERWFPRPEAASAGSTAAVDASVAAINLLHPVEQFQGGGEIARVADQFSPRD
jgi:peptidoglycan/LPS O-acetylase OafA/YrhL